MKKKLTVSSGYDWLGQYFGACVFVLIFGWSFVRGCYSHGMEQWRQMQAERRVMSAASATPWEGSEPPKPTRYVTDLTGVIDPESANALNERLAAFERETSTQIVVYVAKVVPYDTTLEEIANKSFNAWKIGSRGKDNGVLFMVFIDDRKMRIEVGYGLEGILTDALSKRIIENVAKPFFKREAYTEGVEATARAIMDVVRGEGLKGTGQTVAERASVLGASLKAFSIDLLGFLIMVVLIAIGVFGCASVLLLLEKIFNVKPGFGGGGSSGSWTGGSSSSSSSWSSSSSSSSSSSFSGGGGSSGGGGASGSW